MPRVTRAYRDAMRERLLHAAAAVFVRVGHDAATVRDILAEARVAPSTLYAYFEGKDQIIEALFEKAIAASSESVKALQPDNVNELFRWVLRSTMSFPFPESEVLAELRSRSFRGGGAALGRRINRSIVTTFEPLASRLQARGQLAVSDPEAFLELLDIIHDGMARRSGNRTFATSFERVGASFLEVLAQGAVPALTEPPISVTEGAGRRRG